MWGSEFTSKATQKLDSIQTQMAQKPMMRAEVYARGEEVKSVVKSAKAGLREQETRRTEIPRAERRPVVQAKRSGEQLLASN